MAKTHMKYVFLFNLLLILIASSSSSSSSIPFDAFQLVLQWDPATCSDQTLPRPCPKLPLDILSIRGLWPARLSRPFQIVGPCNGSTFNPQNIRPINFGLNQHWPDIVSGNNTEFWREEWRRHGTCSELNQLDYFRFGLESFNSRNWYRNLEIYGIRPGVSVLYTKIQVEEAINRAIGARPAIYCNINNVYGTPQLHQIRVCYSRDSKALLDCPSISGSCPNNFHFFPYMRKLYSYFQVAFQWEPATCFNHKQTRPCVTSPRIRFSVDGVWAMTRSGAIIQSCRGSNFNVNQVSPILVRLDRIWPDLFSRRNEDNWANEWRNHGTCSEDQFGQLQYFSFGVQAYEAYDLLTILRTHNIRPNGQNYTRAAIENAIIRSGASMPYLLCNRVPNMETSFQLHYILLCYDDYGRRVIDCPQDQASLASLRCPASFRWSP